MAPSNRFSKKMRGNSSSGTPDAVASSSELDWVYLLLFSRMNESLHAPGSGWALGSAGQIENR